MTRNIDQATVEGFGLEWQQLPQDRLSEHDRNELFAKYFSLIDWTVHFASVLDMGCGSGRWDDLVASRVGELIAADASPVALAVAKRNVSAGNVSFVECTPETLPYPDWYFDLIFSLGVLHHVPDTVGAVRSLVRKLRPGGTILLYLYYAFDNRPAWFRGLWRISDWTRKRVNRLPFAVKYAFSQVAAALLYWPLARTAKYLRVPNSWPLKFYAHRSFYVMRTDALDRFGTRLEQRFTKQQITDMLTSCGLTNIRFRESEPYWVCAASKSIR